MGIMPDGKDEMGSGLEISPFCSYSVLTEHYRTGKVREKLELILENLTPLKQTTAAHIRAALLLFGYEALLCTPSTPKSSSIHSKEFGTA